MRNGDEVLLEGVDFAEVAPDGRIQRIAGSSDPSRRSSRSRRLGRREVRRAARATPSSWRLARRAPPGWPRRLLGSAA
jgi:hypothetical protein